MSVLACSLPRLAPPLDDEIHRRKVITSELFLSLFCFLHFYSTDFSKMIWRFWCEKIFSEAFESKMSLKSVTVLLEKSEKLKNVLKMRYVLAKKKVKECKMSSKCVRVLLERSEKVQNCPQKALLPFWTKSEKCPQKAFTVRLEKSKKVKNVLKKRYGRIGT